MLNKRAAGEGFSWALGLVVILIIITLAVIVYSFSKIGEKNPITISSQTKLSSSELQRIGVYVISSDFNSSNKGKILGDIYSSATLTMGAVINFPEVSVPVGYSLNKYPLITFHIDSNFYLPCSKCNNKYISVWMNRSANG